MALARVARLLPCWWVSSRPKPPSRRWRRSQVGSVLILVPAAVLVLLLLGAITVDFSIAYLARRQLQDAASAAVNDAAGAALDQARLRGGDGRTALDPAVAVEVARASLGASVHPPLRLSAPPTVVVDGDRVTVVVEADAPYVFAPVVPGGRRRAHVRAVATGELRQE
jgi:Flp pilus assembly protein TadG